MAARRLPTARWSRLRSVGAPTACCVTGAAGVVGAGASVSVAAGASVSVGNSTPDGSVAIGFDVRRSGDDERRLAGRGLDVGIRRRRDDERGLRRTRRDGLTAEIERQHAQCQAGQHKHDSAAEPGKRGPMIVHCHAPPPRRRPEY
ncbi:MAG: hypothetical protein HND48_20785 [Chloroflexi bacterium]|nr:hypothetical protein [Chloroflexota bacterium]